MTTTVQRYDYTLGSLGLCRIPSEKGKAVLWDDYAALEKKYEELKASRQEDMAKAWDKGAASIYVPGCTEATCTNALPNPYRDRKVK